MLCQKDRLAPTFKSQTTQQSKGEHGEKEHSGRAALDNRGLLIARTQKG